MVSILIYSIFPNNNNNLPDETDFKYSTDV